MEPLKRLVPIVPPIHADQEAVTEMDVERGRRTMAPVAQEIEPVSEPLHYTSSVLPAPRELVLPTPTIRPALTESHTLLPFPKTMSAYSPTPPSQLPIHVRIGRVEVRAATTPTPAPARSSPPAPLGFDNYYRVRTYRS
jgi:hypothetical protein